MGDDSYVESMDVESGVERASSIASETAGKGEDIAFSFPFGDIVRGGSLYLDDIALGMMDRLMDHWQG